MRGPAPHKRILDLLRVLSPVDRQNRLLRVADRDLALAMLFMSEPERARLIACVGPGKGRRALQELERFQRSRLEYRLYETAAGVVARALEGSGSVTGPRSYYRPFRSSRTR